MAVILASLMLTTCKALAQIITLNNTRYQVLYNEKKKCAERVVWTLYATDLGASKREEGGSFKVDKRTKKPRPSSSDYSRTGYDRGHLCPSADFSCCPRLMQETFLMSNIIPMSRTVNRGVWKVSEIETRRLAKVYDSVTVIVVVWFGSSHPNTISKKKIAVPSAFGRQVFKASNDSLIAEWYVKNQ